MKRINEIRVDFSLKREVFFVIIGSIVGAISMILAKMILDPQTGIPYDITWIAFGHLLGVFSPASSAILAGLTIHMITALSIGIAIGVFLYKANILIISKLSNGILYGLFAGSVVYIVFFIPVYESVLTHEIARTLSTVGEVEYATEYLAKNFFTIMIGWLIIHLVYGVIVGTVSSLLSIRFGSRYRCSKCDISFSRIDSYQKHVKLVHGEIPLQQIRILILGGGFAGIQVLMYLQKAFQNDIGVDLTLVSKDNFFLFTPMLPEVSSGMIETRNIVTPVRAFCNRARFYEANIDSIDIEDKEVVISYALGRENNPIGWKSHVLKFDYLVIAMGNDTNFFGMQDVAKNSFTIKTLGDAIILRNHVINMLEQADIEHEDHDLTKSLMTFVVVGGGFSGVETVGELNDFVRESIRQFYHNINEADVRIVLISAGQRILPEVPEDLSEFALHKLRENGVEVILNTRLQGAATNDVKLSDGSTILCNTLVWAGGGKPDDLIINLACEHDKAGKLLTNNYLEVQGYEQILSLGDCACIIDPNTGKPYPPTAQHALRQGRIAAHNIVHAMRTGATIKRNYNKKSKKAFDYKTKGVMALIGRRNGVGILFGRQVHGFIGWFIWRFYYLSTLPTVQKKLRVMVDWFIDLFFKRDVTRLRTFYEEKKSMERKDLKISSNGGG
jgi:NADH:ubiquinone reductase (H+-translocating)